MTERTKELAINAELRDWIRQEKQALSYSEFLTEVFDYMQNNAQCYDEFQNHLEKIRKGARPLPTRPTHSHAKEKVSR